MSIMRPEVPAQTAIPEPERVITIDNVYKWFTTKGGPFQKAKGKEPALVRAVDGVSLDISRGEVVGLIGESGSGKSTLGELITMLQHASLGLIQFEDTPVQELDRSGLKGFRKDVQMVFQDPYATLNPRYRVGRTLTEPLLIHGVKDRETREERAIVALERAGLAPGGDFMTAWPTQLSGGQRQRVAIARALVLEPRVLVADEPVSMLDVSIQGAILNLLKELRETMDLAILFISHDLSTVRYLCDRIAIMYRGVVVESGPTEELMERAQHPYTRGLLHAVPEIEQPEDMERELPVGDAKSAIDMDVTECRFADRCAHVTDICRQAEPELQEVTPGHWVRCEHPQRRPVWP